MRAVILAAGRGTRLNGVAGDGPKALVRVGSLSLVERQIRTLRRAGVADVTLVVGCGADEVRRQCGSPVRYIENPRYAETNSLYSLWLARHDLAGGAVILNCDVLFHPQLLVDLLTARHRSALMLAYRQPDAPPLGDEEMKVQVRGGRVVAMSKTMDPAEADGENVGLLRFDAPEVPDLVACLDRVVEAGGLREWAPRAFAAFAGQRPLYAIGTRGYPWIEIDFPEDYERAVRDVLPLVDAGGAPVPSPVALPRLAAGLTGG
jgi:choline kinase